MNNYLILFVAFILGQVGYASVSIYIIQSKVPGITYMQAVHEYFKKEVGSFVMAAAGWAIVMFIFSDFFDTTITRADLMNKDTLTLKERMILYLRASATGLGMFIQHIIYVAFKKGKKAIHDYADKNNIDANT